MIWEDAELLPVGHASPLALTLEVIIRKIVNSIYLQSSSPINILRKITENVSLLFEPEEPPELHEELSKYKLGENLFEYFRVKLIDEIKIGLTLVE